jgi:hypothetical protein
MRFIDHIRQPDLWKAIVFYWTVICLPLLQRKHPWTTIADCQRQMEDWLWSWDKDHCCHCRSRGGSKTFDFVNFIIFRVLRTKEDWAWLASKGGQLSQAMIYFQQNPLYRRQFVKTIAGSRKEYVELISGQLILIGIVTTSNLGLRLDGIILDEEEDMEFKQSTEVYPQLEGMFTDSLIGHMIHLGTLWIATRFNDHTTQYPTKIRPWNECVWLVKAGKVARILADKHVAEWEKDLLYRCIPSAPGGIMFAELHIGTFPPGIRAEQYGFDFGAEDVCVGIWMKDNHTCYLAEEYTFDLERYPGAADFLRGKPIEGEGGGYNDDDKYGAKSVIVSSRLGAITMPVTELWKSTRQQLAREIDIYIDPDRTPRAYRDLKSATFDPKNGLYLKNDTDHPDHFLDAFFHSLGANKFGVYGQQKRDKVAYFKNR